MLPPNIKPLKKPGLKPPNVPALGRAGSTVRVVRNPGKPDEEVLKEHISSNEEYGTKERAAGTAMAGVSLGLTVPGPKGSFLSGRADAWVSRPSQDNEAAINRTMHTCSGLVQAQLVTDIELLRKFFDEILDS